ncbi:4Fe-4S ferredoxin, partial [Candidatus Ozemobacteraceae bacterium]|nr:4Fe-4S ferredoxin [Candidatus Ozemobacteraceae bacterium]
MSANTRKSKVYTIGLRAKGPSDSHDAKIAKLARAIGMDTFDWKNKLVAVKAHFGERGNSAFVRPHYLRPLTEMVKAGGGKP